MDQGIRWVRGQKRGANQDEAVDALFSPVAHLVLGLKGAWIYLDNFFLSIDEYYKAVPLLVGQCGGGGWGSSEVVVWGEGGAVRWQLGGRGRSSASPRTTILHGL
jgi:hypothetical protein